MLTREEADIFKKIMENWICEKNCICITRWEDIRNLINKLTEKPKREIQIGDIYRDKNGYIKEIISIDFPNGISCMSNCGFEYNKINGKYIGECGMVDLDLSKCYKLVETDDVE